MTVDSAKNSKVMNPISYFWNKLEFYSLSPRLNRIKYFALNSFWLSIFFLLVAIDERVTLSPTLMLLIFIFILPNFLALHIRRLNDIDRSAWWVLINVIPILGGIICFIFSLCPGTKGTNSYGEQQPKADKFYYNLILSTPFIFAMIVILELLKD